jgi:tetratricopeptide (TPR) repeat protein
MKKAVVIILLLFLIANFAYRIDWRKTEYALVGELMYFPSGIALRALSMGFYAPLADIAWLRFVQYYGEHRLTDRKFELMYHILDIVTTLDPYFSHAYTLGSLMLTHDAQRPDQAKILLKKGMMNNPNDWEYPFFYGFINYVFIKDYLTAEHYFRLSSLKPDAPIWPRRWAAFVAYKKVGDLETALALWIDLYNHTTNPVEQEIAELYIKDIKMQMDIRFLNEKVKEFVKKFGRVPDRLAELLTYNIVRELPEEPHGEHYYLKDSTVYSTYKWSWKTWQKARERK